jgi:hypothetical protein
MSKIQDLRDERTHMEELLNQRFNFFIIIFGFICAAIPYVNNPKQLMLIFIFGFVIELALVLLIGRAQRRLQINIKRLAKLHDVSELIRRKANKGFILNPFKYSWINLMGYYLPITLVIVLLIATFFTKEIFCFFSS